MRVQIKKEELGFGSYKNDDGTPYTFLIADGYCRSCDEEHLLEYVEELRLHGIKDGYTFYCNLCGGEHVYKEQEYQHNISTCIKLSYSSCNLKSHYFKEWYAVEKIEFAIKILEKEFSSDYRNVYVIKVASNLLWEWNELLEYKTNKRTNYLSMLNKIGENDYDS